MSQRVHLLPLFFVYISTSCMAHTTRNRPRDVTTSWDVPQVTMNDEWRPLAHVESVNNNYTLSSSPVREHPHIMTTLTTFVYLWIGSIMVTVAYAYRKLYDERERHSLLDDNDIIHYHRWPDAF